ncbi:V-set and immunoglobulin domain-containing protein 10-like isoform X2 [Malaclemys terrapin pileata]|uniref:V-set and immunoglobulin domain-containing protein 10-like isoform X2 n=1 Tax=Malaclemys terrapin pileata TaxID=2991368 RepID=UPI0023A89DD3|nr:V-set and immunoglobulin domain-containing protein 10-like isoform X2 [Malaclemys terrapin pileata]
MAGRCPDTWAGAARLLLLLLGPTLPFPLQLPPSPLEVLLGGNLSIPLSYPPAQPPPRIVWQRNLTALADGRLGPNGSVAVAPAYQDRLSVDPQGGTLTIAPVALQDAGPYTVEVFPLGGQVWRGDIQVEVYELVGNVSVMPPSLAVNEGTGSAALTCAPVRGTVTWTKDGQSLDQNPRYRLSAGTLQISRPDRNDSGTYNCTVSNPFSTGTGTAQIRVYYGPEPPTISVSSDRDPDPRRYVRVNSTVGLGCRAPSDPPAQIYWSLADASDPLVPAQPDLTLPRVQLSQAGLYSCLASNPQTQRQLRATLILTVTQIPPGSPFCSLDSVANGTALRFLCSWPGGSPAPSLSLQGLPGGGEQGVGPTLERTLSSPPPALNGTRVTCLGRHLAAEGNCSMTPAPSGVSLSFQASLDPGGTVLLDLQCQGTYRPVEIAWAWDGAPLGPGGRYRVSADGARLTISNFTAPQDLGGYSVRCQNPLGSQESNLTLTGPSVSSWSLVRGSEPGSARLSWAVPEGSVVTGFLIQVPGSPGGRAAGEWQTLQTLGGATRSSTVGGLQPHTPYSFRLLPLLGAQAGEPSHTQTLLPASTLSPGAIAGIVLGSILGMILLLALLVLLIWFLRARWGKREKMPLTPPGTRQHYLPRQFPNGRESDPVEPPAHPSRASSRCFWGDGDVSSISYEEHLRIHGPPAPWPGLPGDSRSPGLPSLASWQGPRTARSATRV